MFAHKKGFSVVAHIHPFDPSHRVMAEMLPGKTIAEIIDELVEYRVGRIIVQIDGWRVKNLQRKPRRGQHVVIRVLPAGDDPARAFDKSGAWGVLIGTGLLVAGFFTGGATWAIGGILFGGGLLSGAIGWGIRAVDAMTVGGAPGSTSLPGIRGARNQLKPWGKIPVVFGKHLITPCYAAKPYTSIGGDKGKDMYLHQLLVVSYGPGRVSHIKIGETLLASNTAVQRNGAIIVDGSFGGVDLDVYQNGTASALFPESVMEENPQMEIRTLDAGGGAVDPDTLWRTTAKNVDKVSIDVTLPRGLYRYDDKGNKQSHSVTITVKRRVTGSGTPWASATTVQTWSLAEAETVTLRYNYTEAVTAGQYDYAVWRSADDATDFKGTSMVQWSAFRSIRSTVAPISADVRSRYVILGLKIKASSELQGIIDQINCIYEPEVNIYSGGVWTGTGFSRNPVAAFLYMLKGPANPRPVPDSAIDYTRLAAWWDICAAAGWTCDYVLANPTRLRDSLQMLAGTGRASFTMRDGGLYSAVVDAPRSELVQIFTARNVRGFSWQKSFEDRPHGFKVNFISADDGYVSNERIVLDDGYKFDIEGDGVLRDWHGVDKTADTNYTVATRFEQIDLPGVTSADIALKHARYLLAVRKLRPEVWTFETDAESIVCEPGDLVRVSHDAIVVGIRPARIKAVALNGGGDATAITIDETIEIESGKSYGVRIRQADGTSIYSTISNAAGYSGSVLTFTVPLGSTDLPAIGDLVVFGINGVETVECIVGGIESLDDLACRVHVVDAAAGVHTADSGTIPAFNSRVTLPGGNPVVESVQENETAKTIAEILDGVYGNAIPTAAPADVASITAKAYQDYIQLTWPEPSGTTLSANPVGYILQRSVDGGTTWKDVSGATNGLYRVQGSVYNWQFARASDGYPEKTDNKGWTPLSSYRFRVKAVNASGVASAGWATASSVDATDYKGWMPQAPSPSGRTAMRTASLSWAEEQAAYGRLRFELQISADNVTWYQPASGLDIYASEDNWRQSAMAGLFNEVSMPAWTQALPLSGQSAGSPIDTTYYYRVRTVLDCPWTGSEGVGASSGGKRASAWSSAVTVLAKANGAFDLVSGAIINQLKADSAGLVGMWTSDGLPEYPDNAAGTQDFNNLSTSLGIWTAARCTPGTFGDDGVVLTATGVNPKIENFAQAINKTVKIKIKTSRATRIALSNGAGTILSYQDIPANTWTIVSLYGNGTIDRYQVFFQSLIAGDTAQLQWIYIGDGTYSTRARDISGGGKHGMVVGATPLADGGFSFDGVNDYIQLPNAAHGLVSTLYFPKFELRANVASQNARLFDFGLANYAFSDYGSTVINFYTYKDATNRISAQINRSLLEGGVHDLLIITDLNPTTGYKKIYIDGVLVTTGAVQGDPSSLAATVSTRYIGWGGSANQYLNATIRRPYRLYNRALTDAEILALYQNPNTGLPGTIIAERIFTENLAAIQGLFASVAGGGDDELNYWNLSAAPKDARPVGSFRAGTATVYIFTNPGAAGTVADPYIALISGNDYIKLTSTGVVMSDTLMAKVGASSATIDAIFTQNIEVGDGGAIYYFADSGTNRRAVRIGDNQIEWGNFPEGGAFDRKGGITRQDTGDDIIMDGSFTTEVSAGGGGSVKSVINAAGITHPSLIQQADGQCRVVYCRSSDGYLCQRVTAAGAWQAETVVNAASSIYSSLIQQADSQYRVVYCRSSDLYLCQRVTVAGVWQAETVINAAGSDAPALIQQADGQYRVVYRRNSDGYLCQRVTAAGVWQAETVINAAGITHPSLIQQADGQYRVVYRRSSDGYLCQRVTAAGVWQAETVINAASSYTPSLIQQADGQYRVVYRRKSDGYLCQRITVAGAWQAETVVNAASSYTPSLIQQADESYYRIAFAESNQLKQLTISATTPFQARIGAGIIESGVSADGASRYQITSDGMLECWGVAYTTTTGALTITYPAEFDSADVDNISVQCTIHNHRGGVSYHVLIGSKGDSATDHTTSTQYTGSQVMLSNFTSTAVATRVSWRAKGKVKP